MWECPKGRGRPRCQAHTSDSWRGGPAGRGLGAQAQSGLATGRSPAGGACGGDGTQRAQAGACLLTPQRSASRTSHPAAPGHLSSARPPMAALLATSPGPQTALSQIQACLLSLLGPKALSCSEGSPGPSRDPCPCPPPSLALGGGTAPSEPTLLCPWAPEAGPSLLPASLCPNVT